MKAIYLLLLAIIFTTSCSQTKDTQKNLSFPKEISQVTYHAHIKNIISNNCTTCHSGKFPSAELKLDNYDNLVNAIKTKKLLKG
jgi:uncharacterized membrane protein